MKIGACGSLLGLTYPLAKELGFDYMEIPFRDLGKITDEEFQQMLLKRKEVDFPVLKANAMLPNDFHLFGEDQKSFEELHAFLEKGFNRAKQLGIEIVVLGSGASRKYPEGMDYNQVEKHLINVFNVVADYSEKYGILVVIEPLQKGETNVFNTVTETCAFVKKLNRKTVKALADSFHMMAEKEKNTSVAKEEIILDSERKPSKEEIKAAKEAAKPDESAAYKLDMYDRISSQIGDILINANRSSDEIVTAARTEAEKLLSRTTADAAERSTRMREGIHNCAVQTLARLKEDFVSNMTNCAGELQTCIKEIQYETEALMAFLTRKQSEMSERIEFYYGAASETVEHKVETMAEECGSIISQEQSSK